MENRTYHSSEISWRPFTPPILPPHHTIERAQQNLKKNYEVQTHVALKHKWNSESFSIRQPLSQIALADLRNGNGVNKLGTLICSTCGMFLLAITRGCERIIGLLRGFWKIMNLFLGLRHENLGWWKMLHKLGLRGYSLSLIQNYSDNRTFEIRVEHKSSIHA